MKEEASERGGRKRSWRERKEQLSRRMTSDRPKEKAQVWAEERVLLHQKPLLTSHPLPQHVPVGFQRRPLSRVKWGRGKPIQLHQSCSIASAIVIAITITEDLRVERSDWIRVCRLSQCGPRLVSAKGKVRSCHTVYPTAQPELHAPPI